MNYRSILKNDILIEEYSRDLYPDETVFEHQNPLVYKHISGAYNYKVINSELVQRDFENDIDYVNLLKQHYLTLLPDKIVMSLLNGNRTLAELQTAWANFKSNASTWDTLTKVETAWDNALTYLEG